MRSLIVLALAVWLLPAVANAESLNEEVDTIAKLVQGRGGSYSDKGVTAHTIDGMLTINVTMTLTLAGESIMPCQVIYRFDVDHTHHTKLGCFDELPDDLKAAYMDMIIGAIPRILTSFLQLFGQES